MAKIFQFREQRTDGSLDSPPSCREMEETAAQIVALMQAKLSRPSPQEMLEILHCTEHQITGMQP